MSAIALRRQPGVTSLDLAEARDRSVRRRVGAAWALLFFNTLTYIPGGLIHVPSHVGKAASQGALPLALLVALTANPKLRLRPNVFLCLVSLLVVDTVVTATAAPHLGDAFRTFRLAEFVVGLWLLTPFWGRDDMLLLRCQLRCLYVALASVMLGFLIAHHHATSYDGRLEGIIWPMLPTQVAQYAAVAAGLTVVLWFGRLVSGRATVVGVTFAVAILLLTHTRTALVGLVVGVIVAGLSLFASNTRVRKLFATGAAVVSVGVISASGIVLTYLERGENSKGLTSLTGRTNFWALVLNTPRTKFEEIFGFGLSNASVDGLPIDSNWLSGYMQEGLFGVVVCAAILVWLIVTAFFQPSGIRRALTLFLLTYCTIASFTEDSFTDVSTYLLHLTVAASLLTASVVPLGVFAGIRK
ncbi:MAG TPA: hypothetical protein VME19_10610 [Streptosporangiaceae bacterium]|nr:hypothetical protein [Streptosporangiaceae bacterium]